MSRQVAAATTNGSPSQVEGWFVFSVGGDYFAVDPELVDEVSAGSQPTFVPFVPDWVEGVVPVRGKIVPVVDMARFFGLTRLEPHRRPRLVVFLVEGVQLATWSADILGIEQPPDGVLEACLSTLPEQRRECLQGQFRLGDKLVFVLDLPRFVQMARERVCS